MPRLEDRAVVLGRTIDQIADGVLDRSVRFD
jgi:hypothetical protein